MQKQKSSPVIHNKAKLSIFVFVAICGNELNKILRYSNENRCSGIKSDVVSFLLRLSFVNNFQIGY